MGDNIPVLCGSEHITGTSSRDLKWRYNDGTVPVGGIFPGIAGNTGDTYGYGGISANATKSMTPSNLWANISNGLSIYIYQRAS